MKQLVSLSVGGGKGQVRKGVLAAFVSDSANANLTQSQCLYFVLFPSVAYS